MAVLNPRALRHRGHRVWLTAWLAMSMGFPSAFAQPAPASREYQIKAVFLFNFAQFVEWPPRAFPEPGGPLVIGVLGEDPFGRFLEDTVRGEKVNHRPLEVQRYRRVEDIGSCHILFISRSETDQFGQIVTRLSSRSILTVSDAEEFGRRGGMIRFVTDNNKIHLRINVEAAKAAGLIISSKLLRPAQLVSTGKD